MVVEWVDCCRSQVFSIALGTSFYSEKVTIFSCSEMTISKGNKRFLAFKKQKYQFLIAYMFSKTYSTKPP